MNTKANPFAAMEQPRRAIALAKHVKRKAQQPYTPHRREHREIMYARCLLVNGPPPPLPYTRGTYGGAPEYEQYKADIRSWWVDSVSSSPKPHMKAAHKFQKRFVTWCRQEQRRLEIGAGQ